MDQLVYYNGISNKTQCFFYYKNSFSLGITGYDFFALRETIGGQTSSLLICYATRLLVCAPIQILKNL